MSIATTAVPTQQTTRGVAPIRVMVVDDSAVVRGLVSRWLNENEHIEVVSSQPNGRQAVNHLAAVDPDVVVLDIEMPEMDGLTALPKMLEIKPGLKVLMASTLTRRNAEVSMRALSLGATDYVPKPETNRGVTTSAEFRRDLVEKILAISNVSPAARPVGKITAAPVAPTQVVKPTPRSPLLRQDGLGKIELRPFSLTMPKIILVGSSTGGPQALFKFTKAIAPAIDQVPVVITQHMPPAFTSILAEHITHSSGRSCQEAAEGQVIEAGKQYVAPGGKHLLLKENNGCVVAHLDDGPQVNYCKPAVDPMFESAIAIYKGAILAVILTGMGSDGREGARKIAAAGGSIIAQDEQSSVVWGMPGAAAQAGVCSAVLPLEQIGPRVTKILRGDTR